jgi:hypothetical protein
MHFLAAMWDGGGNAAAELGVVGRVLARGHTVTVLADPTLADDVGATGAGFRPWALAPRRTAPHLAGDRRGRAEGLGTPHPSREGCWVVCAIAS